MHEYSLVESLLEQVEALAVKHQVSSVQRVIVRIGKFSGVEPELFESAFAQLSESGITKQATLEIVLSPLVCACQICNNQFTVEKYTFRCPACGEGEVTVIGGEEIVLERLVALTEDDKS